MKELMISSACQPVVCGCGHLAASEPFYHADRTLDFNIMIYVVDGVIYVSDDESDHEVSAGELLFLKKGIRHYGKREIPRGTSWHYAHFFLDEPDSGAARFSPDASPIGVHEPLTLYDTIPQKLSGLKNSVTEQRIAEFTGYCQSAESMKRMKINSMFHSLLTGIALAGHAEKKSGTLSARICVWLDDHFSEPFSAARLEQEFFLSYKRLAAVFKAEQGMTMQQYHTSRRMAEAARMLRSTLLPISDVADSLGYDDPLYFSRCFHSCYGVSPRAFRLSARTEY